MKRVIAITAASITIALILLVIAVEAAGGGHGTYLPAKLFFPYSMVAVELWTKTIGYTAGVAAASQWLVYGLVLGRARRPWHKLLGILITHGIAVLVCVLLPSDAF